MRLLCWAMVWKLKKNLNLLSPRWNPCLWILTNPLWRKSQWRWVTLISIQTFQKSEVVLNLSSLRMWNPSPLALFALVPTLAPPLSPQKVLALSTQPTKSTFRKLQSPLLLALCICINRNRKLTLAPLCNGSVPKSPVYRRVCPSRRAFGQNRPSNVRIFAILPVFLWFSTHSER